MALHLHIGVCFFNPLWVGACTEMRTQYLPSHYPMTYSLRHRSRYWPYHRLGHCARVSETEKGHEHENTFLYLYLVQISNQNFFYALLQILNHPITIYLLAELFNIMLSSHLYTIEGAENLTLDYSPTENFTNSIAP